MKKKYQILLVYALIFCFPFFLVGQNILVGGGIGIANYQGDIASNKIWTPEKFNFGINLFATKHINHQWSARGGLLISKLTGADSHYFDDAEHGGWRQRRNYSFNSRIIELSGMVQWNFLDKEIPKLGFHPYLIGGIGLVHSKMEKEDANIDFTIPFGAGISKDINERVAIGLELAIRKVFSDKIDGFTDSDGLGEGDDWYTYFNVNMSYELGKKWEVNKVNEDF